MEKYLSNYLLVEKYLTLKSDTKKMIIEHFKGYDTIVWNYIENNRALFKIDDEVKLPKFGLQGFEDCYNELMRITEAEIGWIDPKSIYYPETLRFYKPEVKMLFAKGDKKCLNETRNVAIVGSRKPTAYGRKVAYDLAKYLAMQGLCVVSGMAMGIDSQAHRGALDGGGKTIAVLASGVNRPYPTSNTNLYHEIIETGGLILSEQFIDDLALKFHFPLRNRIISAISEIVVIIEAGEKSGSLITATHAIEQGKTVFSLPGSLHSPQSIGSNHLIYEGAIPLVKFEHIIETMGLKNRVVNKVISTNHLSDKAKVIYELLKYNKRMRIDDIFETTQFEYSEIISALGELVLDDLCEYMTLNEVALI